MESVLTFLYAEQNKCLVSI